MIIPWSKPENPKSHSCCGLNQHPSKMLGFYHRETTKTHACSAGAFRRWTCNARWSHAIAGIASQQTKINKVSGRISWFPTNWWPLVFLFCLIQGGFRPLAERDFTFNFRLAMRNFDPDTSTISKSSPSPVGLWRWLYHIQKKRRKKNTPQLSKKTPKNSSFDWFQHVSNLSV